jgi:hypothetical protein
MKDLLRGRFQNIARLHFEARLHFRGRLRYLAGRGIRASLLLGIFASAAFAGTVTGTIHNGTTGKPAAGVDVILIQLLGTMQPVAQTKSDADGHYQIDNPALGTGPMLIRAVYRGVNYHEPATPGKTTVDVEVYEPTDDASAIKVEIHAVILQPDGNDLVVGEEFRVKNSTQPPVAYYRPDGSFTFSLPEGAQLSDVSAVGTSGMPVIQQPIDKSKNSKAILFPFRPGETDVRVSYKLPYTGNQARMRLESAYATGQFGVFAPPTVHVTGDGLTLAGQDQGLNAYIRGALAANTEVTVNVSGTAPPQQSQNSGAAAPSGDDTQNPSINSRAETGVAAPVASITTLPARLESLQWILIGGFASIFILGVFYLWRQPQAAVAAAGPMDEMTSAPVARVTSNSAVAAIESSRSENVTAAGATSLDREVRGSLDELKDSLFRLELRREAGTVTEEEYVRERDRVQKVLRDLVKG